MALSCIICEIKRTIGGKSWFFIPPLHSSSMLLESPSEYCHPVWCGKTRMVGLPDGEKIEDICNRLDTIPACDGRTSCHGIVRATHTRRAVKTDICGIFTNLCRSYLKWKQIREDHSCMHSWWIFRPESFRYQIKSVAAGRFGGGTTQRRPIVLNYWNSHQIASPAIYTCRQSITVLAATSSRVPACFIIVVYTS